MNVITTEKMVCTTTVNSNILTPGKIYVVTTNKSIDTSSDIDITLKTFIGDDGNDYLLAVNSASIQYNDLGEFITLEEWRQRQLNKIL